MVTTRKSMPTYPGSFKELILYEDNHLLILNKPSGILSQGDSSDRNSLNSLAKEYIKHEYNKPGNVFLGIVHRLDLPVSGAIVYAKTSKGASRLSEQIRDRKFDKIYIAVIEGNPSVLQKESWITLKDELIRIKDRTEVVSKPGKDTQKGTLECRLMDTNGTYSFVAIRLITGRKHQIRAQLSHRNASIVGDVKYGSHKRCANSILLHSYQLSFLHPTTREQLTIQAEIPEEFSEFIKSHSFNNPENYNIIKTF